MMIARPFIASAERKPEGGMQFVFHANEIASGEHRPDQPRLRIDSRVG